MRSMLQLHMWLSDQVQGRQAHLPPLRHLQAIPYLPEDPIASISLDLLPVSRVMKSPVVTFQVRLPRSHMLRSHMTFQAWFMEAMSYFSRPS
jgi:hypothetical protein